MNGVSTESLPSFPVSPISALGSFAMDSRRTSGGMSAAALAASPPSLPETFLATVALVDSKQAIRPHCRLCFRKPESEVYKGEIRNSNGSVVNHFVDCKRCGPKQEVKWQYALQLGVVYNDRIYALLAFDKVVETLVGISAKEFHTLDQNIFPKLGLELYPSAFAMLVASLVSRSFFFTLDTRASTQKDPKVKDIVPAEPSWVSLKEFLEDQRRRKGMGSTSSSTSLASAAAPAGQTTAGVASKPQAPLPTMQPMRRKG